MNDIATVKEGDRITFRSPTRDGNRKLTRVVNGFWGDTDMPTVRAYGWDRFAVRPHEIIEVQAKEEADA